MLGPATMWARSSRERGQTELAKNSFAQNSIKYSDLLLHEQDQFVEYALWLKRNFLYRSSSFGFG